jgi:hypothetical protein
MDVFKVKLPVAPFLVKKLKLSRAALAEAVLTTVPRTIVAPTVATTPIVAIDRFRLDIVDLTLNFECKELILSCNIIEKNIQLFRGIFNLRIIG